MTRRSGQPILALLGAALLLGALLAAGCGKHSLNPIAPGRVDGDREWIRGTPQLYRAIDAQEASSAMLLGLRGVVGTSAGLDAAGKGVVRVLVERADVPGVPARINGLRVVKVVIGRVRAWGLTDETRPLHIGVSVGNANECLPGTLGCIVERGGRDYALSANHVLARQNQAHIGESTIQPSLPDVDPNCGTAPPRYEIGQLADFQRVYYDGKTPNYMDAAIAAITLPPGQTFGTTPAGYYGAPGLSPITASLGMKVQKLGRTTALTHGIISGVNTKVKVTFPSGTALMVGQLETSNAFGGFGDSGSLVVTDDSAKNPVGMVIGGDNKGSAIVTPIDRILSRFDAQIINR